MHGRTGDQTRELDALRHAKTAEDRLFLEGVKDVAITPA